MNTHALAQPAAQQHSVRQPAADEAGRLSAPLGCGGAQLGSPRAAEEAEQAAAAAAAAVHWWQDPKMTFGPPGDPAFLATQAAQVSQLVRPVQGVL